jgi:hypothetical protein
MNAAINPYQASSFGNDGSSRMRSEPADEFSFCGAITKEDFARMIPGRDFMWLLLVIVTPVSVIGAFGVMISALSQFATNKWVIPGFVFAEVVLIGMPLGLYYLLAGSRAKRILRQRPDLLSTARGTLGPRGMFFDDGFRWHWYDASMLQRSKALKSGVRIQWSADPYLFLALSKPIFENFDQRRLQDLARYWREHVPDEDQPSEPNEWVERMRAAPADAIHYSGEVTFEYPGDTPEKRKQAWSLTVQWLMMAIGLACLCLFGDRSWNLITVGGLICTIAYAWVVATSWRKIGQPGEVVSWTQSGWVNRETLLVEVTGAATRCPLTTLQVNSKVEENVIWFTSQTSMIPITKDLVATPADWQQLQDWFA